MLQMEIQTLHVRDKQDNNNINWFLNVIQNNMITLFMIMLFRITSKNQLMFSLSIYLLITMSNIS